MLRKLYRFVFSSFPVNEKTVFYRCCGIADEVESQPVSMFKRVY